MKLIFTIIIQFILSYAFSQTLPIDFESPTTWENFGGGMVTSVANPYNNADNPSANVGKMVKGVGEVYGGSYNLQTTPLNFTTNNVFSMKVYAPHFNTKVLLKVENATNQAVYYQKEQVVRNSGSWQTIIFNFNNINKTQSYSKIVIIFDNGTAGDGTAAFTYYFDDVKLYQYGTGLTQMNLPVTFEDATVDYGLVGFEGLSYSEVVANPVSGGLNTSSKVAKVIKGSTAGASAGTTITNLLDNGFATAIPFTASSAKMNVMVYSPDAGIPVRLKVEDHNDPTHSVETQVNTTVANQWEILEFNFLNQATGTAALNPAYTFDKASIFFNFGTNGAVAGEKTYYFDNVKFGPISNAGLEDIHYQGNTILVYPNPVKTGNSVKISKEVSSVEIFNTNGILVQKANSNLFNVEAPKGIYVFRIIETNGTISTQKMVVQ